MSENTKHSRRVYLKGLGVASAAGLTGTAGCLGSITGGGPIPMGSILPITGVLSAYGNGMQEAANLAADHVNSADGPMGREISMTNKDSGTKPEVGVQKYNSLVNEQGIVGFVGAASSGVSTAIAENVAGDQVMEVSNASTSPALAEIGYDGDTKYFGRTAPNDGQQGIIMGRIMNQYQEADSAAFIHVANAYGKGLAQKAKAAFDGETLQLVGYDTKATDYTSTLDKLHQGNPDAIGFVGYPGNGKTILQQWSEGGYGTSSEDWVLSEGLNSDDFLQSNSALTGGMWISSPDPEATDGAEVFENEMGSANTLFAPHAYDAIFLQALAMEKAGEASGTAIAQNIQSISSPGGTKVTVDEFSKAAEELGNGNEINYQGASSPVNMNDSLEPLNQFAIIKVLSDGSKEIRESIPRSFFEGKL